MGCSPPGSSVQEILQAIITEWAATPFSRESSWPTGWTWVSRIAGRFFTIWATREAPTLAEIGRKQANVVPRLLPAGRPLCILLHASHGRRQARYASVDQEAKETVRWKAEPPETLPGPAPHSVHLSWANSTSPLCYSASGKEVWAVMLRCQAERIDLESST